jgi:hypothetical protein
MNRRLLLFATVALFAATAAFGALWLTERSSHSATAGQWATVDAEVRKLATELRTTERMAGETRQKTKQTAEKLAADQAAFEPDRPCVEAGKEFSYGGASDETRIAVLTLILARCR